MTVYNTPSDSANTAVRAFLTKVGEYYLGHSFNTSSGLGKKTWQKIREKRFRGRCAYCNKKDQQLQIEHLIMFNKTEYGLHHPGNVVPCCIKCNKREKRSDKTYMDWEEHLKDICEKNNEVDAFKKRKGAIISHMKEKNYPVLTLEEKHAIEVIAKSLYENIKMESEKSLMLYKKLDDTFIESK